MKRPGKNSIYERGIALITVLAISFILLGILIILMAEAYNHMGRALKYNSDARALTIAEYGVQKAIYELEEDLTWAGVTDKPFSRGSYTVIVVNNFTNPDPKGTVPANSIWVKSTGEFANGKFKKTVEVILSYQLIPYAAISDGRLEMRGTNPLTFKLKAIPGFTGKIHSNYNSASLKYDPSYPNFFDMLNVKTLDIDGTTFSSSGTISAACGTDINTAGGTVITSSSLDKSIPPLTYSDVKPAKGLTRLDQYAPPGVTFAGKIRKSAGGDLEALCSTPLGKVWFSVTAPFLPDGMSWNRATSTLKVSGNLKYYNDEDFEIENINLEVDENSEAAMYVDGCIKFNNMGFVALNGYTLASQSDIEFNNTTFRMDAPNDKRAVAIFCGEDFTINTSSTDAPSGGNYLKGAIYIKDGAFKINNYCALAGSDNSIAMEGVIISGGNTGGEGIIVNNEGSSDFNFSLLYNPHLARTLITSSPMNIQLQPVFWRVY